MDTDFLEDLPPRVRRVLEGYGVTTKAQCVALGAQGLRRLRGMGDRAVNEVAHVLRDHGLELPLLRGEGVELPGRA